MRQTQQGSFCRLMLSILARRNYAVQRPGLIFGVTLNNPVNAPCSTRVGDACWAGPTYPKEDGGWKCLMRLKFFIICGVYLIYGVYLPFGAG
jgi:hypothetical protein